MVTTLSYSFRRMNLRDAPMIRSWRAQPHVREWWGEPDDGEQIGLSDPSVARWVVSVNGHRFGYIQDYNVHEPNDHHFAHLPFGARGIDQYIGDPDMLGQGHGTAFIRQHMQMLFRAGAPVIATDPHPKNARAIRVYEKLGFRISGPAQDTAWGRIVPMLCAG